MNVKQLRNLLQNMPSELDNATVYYATDFTFSHDGVKENFDPESLTGIDEFAIDLSDNCIVLRGQP